MVKPLYFRKAKDYILYRLENELSPKLTYHCLEHTTDEVVPAADRLAMAEKVNDEDRLLLLTAAYYHDSGFIYQSQGHEAISIQLVEQALPGFGYSESQVAVIRGIIQATSIPQSPTNLLERIMADSDLDYLGHEDFWKRSDDLRNELENYGQIYSEVEWYIYQLTFIKSHTYFTASERLLREFTKQKHLVEIQEQINKAKQ